MLGFLRCSFACCALLISLAACGPGPAATAEVAPVPEASQPEPKPVARVTDRPANTSGAVLVPMYHKFADEESSMTRSRANFRKDLERLYRMGFRPVTLSDYLDDKMNLPPGASPVVITIDDSPSSAFSFLPDGSLDPECGLGIWAEFAKDHPDFPIRATFFVLPNGPFGPAKDAEAKLKMLKEWDCEVGSHTITHPRLRDLDDAKAKQELEESAAFVRSLGFEPRGLALPFGISPKNAALLETYDGVVRVGAGPAPAPGSQDFKPRAIPRIQAYPGEYGIDYWLDRVESGKVQVYVQP